VGKVAKISRVDKETIPSLGGGNRALFTVNVATAIDTITDFGGVGNRSQSVVRHICGSRYFKIIRVMGLTARNMLLTQDESDLLITFEGVENTGSSCRICPRKLR
jgi:hypothetical protein